VAATANISDDVAQTADRMDVAVRQALEQIQTASRSIDELISIKAVAAADAIGGKVAAINRTVSEQTEAFSALVTDKSAQLEIALHNHSNILSGALEQTAREAEGLMSESTSRIMTDVTAALGKLNDSNILLQKVLDASTANLAHLETSVAEQTSTYSSAVREAIGSTEEAGRLVTEHVSALQATIAGMVQEFGSILGNLNVEAASIDRAADGLNSASATTLTMLDERRGAMDALASSFTARADDIDERMRGFAQSIADTINETEHRLLTARRSMEELLATTTTSVSETMENTSGSINLALSETTGQLQAVLTDAAEQVQSALSSTSSRIESVVGAATSQLQNALGETTNHLEAALGETTSRVETVLGATTSQLETALGRTTSRVESVLGETTSRVETALSATTVQMEGVLTQSTNLLETALSSTSSKVTGQLGQFTTAANSESERAADALRQTQTTLILEMQQALEEATKRFNETAQAMRATAREVGSELESTRSELARGVMELPEETKASAAAMRRVVAEQIEALSELNAIVRAQPATHDLNDSRRNPPPRREEARPEPARETPRAATPIPAPAPQPAQAATVAAPRPAPARTPTPTPAPQPAPATAAAAKGEEGGGWLRDVLRNASTTAAQQRQPAPAAAPQSGLTNLTEEIAKAMDQQALADAWARYQAGEQNVFSRRIYTLSGQGTYDQVRKRLQQDPEFARTSATYMAEFEQLLQQAAQSSDPAAAARDFLLSDRGRVYTMLAHASGRVS